MRAKRLTFRTLAPGDALRIAELAGDWDVASMTARIPYPYTKQHAEEWMDSIAEEEFVRAILLEGELIGACGYFPSADGSAEIGYWLGKPWWGRGFATEAGEALVRYCFQRGRFRRLTCCHFADNTRSQRVIVKLGFTPTGACQTFCEARRREVPAMRYERRKPALSLFRRRAA